MFGVTLTAAIFGTIIYFRPATIATDCGGVAVFVPVDAFTWLWVLVVVVAVVDVPCKLLLSSFELRLAVTAAFVIRLPLGSAVSADGPDVLLLRDDRSAAAIATSMVDALDCCASPPPVAVSVRQRCFFLCVRDECKGNRRQTIRKWGFKWLFVNVQVVYFTNVCGTRSIEVFESNALLMIETQAFLAL